MHSVFAGLEPPWAGAVIRAALDRRVPQFVGLYVAGSWGFVQFVDWVVDQFLLSPTLTRVVFVGLILLLPSVIVIAWRHGAPGPDPWKVVDGAAVAGNVLVMAGILVVVFRGEALGATTTTKVLVDPEGNTVERVVPTDDFQRSVLVFDAENRSGDAALDWLEVGLADQLGLDLFQDVFVSAVNVDPELVESLAAAGLDVTGDVPLALKRELSAARGIGRFISMSFDAVGDSLSVDTELYDSETGRSVSSRSYRGTEEADMVDRMSVDVRRDLGVPDAQIERSPDLPVAELTSPSVEARQAIAEALRVFRRDQSSELAAAANRVTALDSTAAYAHFLLAGAALGAGDPGAGATAMRSALRHGYRLPERLRLSGQVMLKLLEGDQDAALRGARFWVEIYPRDADGRRILGLLLEASDDPRGALREHQARVAIDPTNVAARRDLARAFGRTGQQDSALIHLERILAQRPTDVDTRIDIGAQYQLDGRLAEARGQFEAARTMAPLDPVAPLRLARLDIREGDPRAALARLDEIRTLERTPEERLARTGLEESVFYHLGQFRRLEEAFLERLEMESLTNTPIQVAIRMADSEYLIYAEDAGVGDRALERMAALQAGVEPPLGLTLESVALHITLARGDTTGARATLDSAEAALTSGFLGTSVAPRVAWARGRLAEMHGDGCAASSPHYTRALEERAAFGHARRDRLRCSLELADWEQAEEDMTYLLENQPAHGLGRLAIARYLVARGRIDEARDHLDIVLAQWADADPEYRPARDAAALRVSLGGG